MVDTWHVVPVADTVEHTTDDGCVCGPTMDLTETVHGDGWLAVHHSLDGREAKSA